MRERTFVVHEQVYDSSSFDIVSEGDLIKLLARDGEDPEHLEHKFDIIECLGDRAAGKPGEETLPEVPR